MANVERKSWGPPVLGFLVLSFIVIVPLAFCMNQPETTPYEICMEQYRGSQVYADNFIKTGDRSIERQCLAQEQAVYAQRQAERDAKRAP